MQYISYTNKFFTFQNLLQINNQLNCNKMSLMCMKKILCSFIFYKFTIMFGKLIISQSCNYTQFFFYKVDVFLSKPCKKKIVYKNTCDIC